MTQIHGRPGEYVRTLRNKALRNVALGVIGVVLAVVGVVLLGGFGAFAATGLRPVAAAFLVLGSVGLLWWIRQEITRSEKAAVGLRSEVRVGKVLNKSGAYAVVHGALLGAGGDADHVVLGPVLAVVETKTGRGQARIAQGSLQMGRRTLRGDPLAQARRQAAALGKKMNARAEAIVCVPDMEGSPQVHNRTTVCSLADLPGVLRQAPQVLDAATAQAWAEHLSN